GPPRIPGGAGEVQGVGAGISRPLTPSVSREAVRAKCSCRIQVMIGRFGSRRADMSQKLTCRIVSFDSLCAASAKPPRVSPRDLPQGREEDPMKYLFAAVMLASAVVGFSEAASAAGGCGPGWY